jgi:hypothetical protein
MSDESLVLPVPVVIENDEAQYHDQQARLLADRAGALTEQLVTLEATVAALDARLTQLTSDVLDYYSPALRNSMIARGDSIDIGAGWVSVTGYEELPFSSSFGINMTLLSGEISIDYAGDYIALINGSISHDSANGDRTFYIRFYSVTEGAAVSGEMPIFVGRNQTGSNISAVMPFYTTDLQTGDQIVLQVGGTADVFSSEVLDVLSLTIFTPSVWLGGVL